LPYDIRDGFLLLAVVTTMDYKDRYGSSKFTNTGHMSSQVGASSGEGRADARGPFRLGYERGVLAR
jgi:hypothetical protein